MKELVDVLHEGPHSLAVRDACSGHVAVFDGRGVSDLFRLLNEAPGFLRGADVADKVVGKGAAALMILAGINTLHADVISSPALELFEGSLVKVSFGKEVPNIINRGGDGICPVETLCLRCSTAAECLPLITKFMNSINN